MSIIVFTGKPGSGKTYRVVHQLMKCPGKYFVFHNIAGLHEIVFEEGEFIQDFSSIPDFFTKKKQEEVTEWASSKYNRPVLIIIDEAQRWFGDRNPILKEWLSWHRHLGQDIWIVAQHYKMIHSDYYNLADYEIRAKRGIATSQFIYQFSVGGEVYKTDRVRKSKAVFASYRSFEQEESKKGRSKLMQWGVGAAAFAVIAGVYLIGWGLPSTFSRMGPGPKSSKQHKTGVREAAAAVAPSHPTILQEIRSLSFAGRLGSDVLLQSKDGSLGRLSDFCSCSPQILEVNGNSIVVSIPPYGVVKLLKKRGYVKLPEERNEGPSRLPGAPARQAGKAYKENGA